MDATLPDLDLVPIADWEDAIGRMAAHRLRARAIGRLADGTWDGHDLEDAIGAAESRATARQRVLIWEALTGDPVLSALAAGSQAPAHGYDPVLESRFGFDAEDLRANTDGRLSDEQDRILAAAAAAMGRHERRTETLTEGAPYRVHHLVAPDGAVPLSLERLAD